jgi:hypothetical protein
MDGLWSEVSLNTQNTVDDEGHLSEDREAGQNADALLHFNFKHEQSTIV